MKIPIPYNKLLELHNGLILEENETWCLSDLYDALGKAYHSLVPFKVFKEWVFTGSVQLIDQSNTQVELNFGIETLDQVDTDYSDVRITCITYQ